MITVYTKANCDKCDDIKAKMKKAEVEFEEKSTTEQDVMQELVGKLRTAGMKNPLLPVLEFDDGSLVSNDMGLYKSLKERDLL